MLAGFSLFAPLSRRSGFFPQISQPPPLPTMARMASNERQSDSHSFAGSSGGYGRRQSTYSPATPRKVSKVEAAWVLGSRGALTGALVAVIVGLISWVISRALGWDAGAALGGLASGASVGLVAGSVAGLSQNKASKSGTTLILGMVAAVFFGLFGCALGFVANLLPVPSYVAWPMSGALALSLLGTIIGLIRGE